MDFEHERRLTQVEGVAQSNKERLDEVEKRQDNLETLATSVATLATREERVEKDVKEIKADVKSLAAKPGKRWENIVDKALWAVVGAALVYILSHVGL